ncbi:MAG: hypothetical protein RLZZ385_1347, partial [Pseudomonadota bacterium]
PEDAGCQDILRGRLEQLGFAITSLPFGPVTNFWARYGDQQPLLVFAGHTDVVPPGPEQAWTSPPFTPSERDGRLYGRGAADMKGSLAAMVTACENYLGSHQPLGSIGFLITSDEEGVAVDGTVRVVDWLLAHGQQVKYCIVGEPSSVQTVGDTIKIGRRGSLSGRLRIKGVQGHIAYPHLARNPIHLALAPLQALMATPWDQGNAAFPPTSFQISNIHGGTGAGNVIPGELVVDFNFRFSTETDAGTLRQTVEAVLESHDLTYEIDWQLSGNPFLTAGGELIEQACASITRLTGLTAELSTAGGTSDGRFIAPATGCQLIELGPVNSSIHKVDEHVCCAELDTLSLLYQDILARLLGEGRPKG